MNSQASEVCRVRVERYGPRSRHPLRASLEAEIAQDVPELRCERLPFAHPGPRTAGAWRPRRHRERSASIERCIFVAAKSTSTRC